MNQHIFVSDMKSFPFHRNIEENWNVFLWMSMQKDLEEIFSSSELCLNSSKTKPKDIQIKNQHSGGLDFTQNKHSVRSGSSPKSSRKASPLKKGLWRPLGFSIFILNGEKWGRTTLKQTESWGVGIQLFMGIADTQVHASSRFRWKTAVLAWRWINESYCSNWFTRTSKNKF